MINVLSLVVLLNSLRIIFQKADSAKDKALNCASFTECQLRFLVVFS